MVEKTTKAVWVKVLKETPLSLRRRASAYLKNIRKETENEWLIWSDKGSQYKVRLEKERVTCSCPYFQQEKGYCKHICAVAASELTRMNVMPWLKNWREDCEWKIRELFKCNPISTLHLFCDILHNDVFF